MAYMHKLTYELLSQNGIESTQDDYFEIDDFIALPVQELNRRGYTTMPYCYNGDVFAGTNEATMTNYTEDAPTLPSIPDGWKHKDNFLEYWFDRNLAPFAFMEESVKVMRKLYEWTRSLPDLSVLE